MLACLARETNLLMACGVLRRSNAEFGEEHIHLFGRLLPHLRRSLEVGAQIAELDVRLEAAHQVADSDDCGRILVDADARILFCNAAAGSILVDGRALSQRHGRLVATRSGPHQNLRRLIESAAARRGTLGGAMRLALAGGATALAIVVVPAPSGSLAGISSGGCLALVSVTDPKRRSLPPERYLATMFGLTKAEAALSIEILNGNTPGEIASKREVSIATVRAQLRGLYAKTGTSGQVELFCLLRGVPAPVYGKEPARRARLRAVGSH